MKNLKLFILPFILSFISANLFSQSITTYKNSRFNYSLNIPDQWDKEEKPSKNSPEKVSFKDPDGNVLLIYAKVDKSYSGKTANDMDPGTMYMGFQKEFKGANMLESDYKVLDEIPAMFCKYEYTFDGNEYTQDVYYLVKGDIFYMINVIAKNKYFDAFETQTLGYILSLHIIDVRSSNYFRNERYDFQIVFPDGWKSFTEGTTFGAEISAGAGVFVVVNKDNNFVGYTGNDIRPEVMLEFFRTKYPDANLIDNSYIFIDSYPAMMAKYKCSATINGVKDMFLIIHYYIVRDDMLYVLQGRALEKNFDTYKDKMNESLLSFQFISNKKDN
jgi:hypothetical protein